MSFRFNQNISLLIIFAIAALSAFCFLHLLSADAMAGHNMALGGKMSSLHTMIWKVISEALPQDIVSVLFLAVLLAVFSFYGNISDISRQTSKYLFYLKHFLNLEILSPLRYAFSQGILNPKTF